MINKLKMVTQLTLVMALALSTSMVIAAEGHNDHSNNAAADQEKHGMSGVNLPRHNGHQVRV